MVWRKVKDVARKAVLAKDDSILLIVIKKDR